MKYCSLSVYFLPRLSAEVNMYNIILQIHRTNQLFLFYLFAMIHTLCGCWCVLCSSHVACCFAIDFSIGHHHRGIKFGTRFFFAYRIRIYTREHNNTKTNPFYFCISFRSVIQITIRHKLKNAPRKQQQQKTSTNNSPHDKS